MNKGQMRERQHTRRSQLTPLDVAVNEKLADTDAVKVAVVEALPVEVTDKVSLLDWLKLVESEAVPLPVLLAVLVSLPEDVMVPVTDDEAVFDELEDWVTLGVPVSVCVCSGQDRMR